MKNNNSFIIALFLLLTAIITLQDLLPNNHTYRPLISIILVLITLYMIAKNLKLRSMSYKTANMLLLSFFIFTCVYHVVLSIIIQQPIFENYFWIFLCFIYLLSWLRMRYISKK
ncbi:hypothetical protein DCC85_19150 [Paenibacillus sp. CAA11]|nr:hypothetical protein DCC85_19150 [Paenibacillus sp. CAA11]